MMVENWDAFEYFCKQEAEMQLLLQETQSLCFLFKRKTLVNIEFSPQSLFLD